MNIQEQIALKRKSFAAVYFVLSWQLPNISYFKRWTIFLTKCL